jgi:transglutaminase-like putative cysteine protease
MNLQSGNLEDYLASDTVVDWREPAVLQKARELGSAVTDQVERARVLFEWVRDEIPHSKDIDSELVTCSASEVLRQSTGICYAKSHLLAALLRANGIPAGFCYQVLRRDAPDVGLVLHGLNGVYLSSLDRWIRVDPRGNVGGINAQFGVDTEQLAFPMDRSAGEFIYDTIFSSPAQVVVETLRRHRSRSAMWPHLPSGLASE